MKQISGGVCAAQGFAAAGIHCGVRKSRTKKDLALIASAVPASAAAVYTTNLVKGAPLTVTKAHLADGRAQAIICNSGNANTCNADGLAIAQQMSELTAAALGIRAGDVVVASTGVIGQPLNLAPIAAGIPPLASALSENGSADACEAIMTTDTKKKEIAVEFTLGGKTCRLGGIAKGSGMIHPNMATMLVFLTTDAAISPAMLQKALSGDIRSTFNMISVDGDTSTNDMVCLLANGLAGNAEITEEGEDYAVFMKALNSVNVYLCRAIAGDGEGATKLLECAVTGAFNEAAAKAVAKSVVCSSLTKAAMFGEDANWGRVLCAIGYSGVPVDVTKVGVVFRSKAGSVELCRGGAGVPFSEELASQVLHETEIEILVSLGDGAAAATAWGCDLSYEYVRINGDYRT
ncbi:MAG: bifunctional glutamate N-acetyltransferase/amino-acid acetyltransferase ArgJ [Oscillospiraceae bacterium]|nr:bifunctional glutamate N-acetyltransferase/amino-acid acetyltransferase ArgJ [Oscillospiraceae bacterium]MBQ5406059.1 bifunctional glutamate N-acetyltransferase/amino-acid acetyltransferase ArgJ [Oscillospiraceae bacterium]